MYRQGHKVAKRRTVPLCACVDFWSEFLCSPDYLRSAEMTEVMMNTPSMEEIGLNPRKDGLSYQRWDMQQSGVSFVLLKKSSYSHYRFQHQEPAGKSASTPSPFIFSTLTVNAFRMGRTEGTRLILLNLVFVA
ncbi:hypothetical protein A6R68_21360 [Neotoma lepida]|uniref:Uncharacterized protein n=1 Tax=Neotoma lepida TaxID=56216 RepID=A0A1A6HQD1_NEOLE|nr:hypothetical protein A6R68_21360 [Neotoma lepida]